MKADHKFQKIAWVAMPLAVLLQLGWAKMVPGRTRISVLAGLLVGTIVMLILSRLTKSFSTAIFASTMSMVLFHSLYSIAELSDSHQYGTVGAAFRNWGDEVEPYNMLALGGITLVIGVVVAVIRDGIRALRSRRKVGR